MKTLPIIIIVLMFSLVVGGCMERKGTVVSCSDYQKIIDKYDTPKGTMITIEWWRGPVTFPVPMCNGVPFKGGYYSAGLWSFGCGYVNLTELNESETGMRDACVVI
jgi:hypothetical protein